MRKWNGGCGYLLIGLAVCFFGVSIFLGRYAIPPEAVAKTLLSGLRQWVCGVWDGCLVGLSDASVTAVSPIRPNETQALHHTVIFGIRLPRILAAILGGAGISVAGTGFQGLFKNPLVSPERLGVASGAGFGAALGILLSGRPLVIQGLAKDNWS